jgi:hypothetical protein
MSRGACVFLGITTLLVGACFVLVGIISGAAFPVGAGPFYGLAALCAVIGLACLFPRSRPVTLRIVGAAMCGAYVWYAIDVWNKPIRPADESNIFAAIAGLIVFGLPGAYMSVTARYPRWGRLGHVFARGPADKSDSNGDSSGSD